MHGLAESFYFCRYIGRHYIAISAFRYRHFAIAIQDSLCKRKDPSTMRDLFSADQAPEWYQFPQPQASFAAQPRHSRGRCHPKDELGSRTPFQRDRDRVIHCGAFRRLKQKTQVFLSVDGESYRTRLTHSLEVSQLARSMARRLGLCEDLAETFALVHDIGHPPFGHAGEQALNEVMQAYGGFDHNAQALRILTLLEQPYVKHDGLNLTFETLSGTVKHNGPLIKKAEMSKAQNYIFHYSDHYFDLDLGRHACLEAQLAAFCDDIAYNNHDLDDGLRAGLILPDQLEALPLIGSVLRQVRDDYPGDIAQERRMQEMIRRLIGIWVDDLFEETSRRIKKLQPETVEDIYDAGEALSGFSVHHQPFEKAVKKFLHENMYRHATVSRAMSQAKRVVRELFQLFMTEPETLPEPFRQDANQLTESERAILACDVIASMTDIAAIEEHRKLFNLERWV